MAVEGFTSIKKDAAAFKEALKQKANRSGESTSPYQEGMKFKLIEDPIDIVRNVEGKVFTILWLERDDKTKVELWLSTLEKHAIENGQRVEPNTTINTAFRQATKGKDLTNEEFAQAFVDIVGSKEFTVVRTHYTRTIGTKYGPRSFPASLVGFEFMD